MKKAMYILTLSVLFVLNSSLCNGQLFYTFNKDLMKKELENLKNSTLYVVIDEAANDKNAEYAKIFEENWKYSKVVIIAPKEMPNYLKEGNFFFTLILTYDIGFDFEKPAAFQSFSYKLWTPDVDNLKKMKKKIASGKDINFSQLATPLANINLIFDKSESFTVEDVMNGEYFGNGYPLYCGTGIFKNYLQGFQTFLKTNGDFSMTVCNKAEIKKLKKGILYVPSSLLVDNSGITFSNYKKNKKPVLDAEEIFADYPGKYKVISIKELNEKIINNDEPIYYISKPNTNILVVTNSQTGELIFQHTFNESLDKLVKRNLKKLINSLEDEK